MLALALLSSIHLQAMAPANAAETAAETAAATDPATDPATVTTSNCETAPKYPLPLPSTLKQAAFQNYDVALYDFVNCGKYLNWARDKSVRDTGPFAFGQYYGTHPVVRLFYSPQVITWLKNGKKGPIPDGAMIIKEQYSPKPAARYANMHETRCQQCLSGTIQLPQRGFRSILPALPQFS
jgi:hypothetical protein